MSDNKPSWPIRVGGIYQLLYRNGLGLRITSVDGEDVEYVHRILSESYSENVGREFGAGRMPNYALRSQCISEDQSPIPAMTALLEKLVSWDESQRIGSELHAIVTEARELLASQAVSHATA